MYVAAKFFTANPEITVEVEIHLFRIVLVLIHLLFVLVASVTFVFAFIPITAYFAVSTMTSVLGGKTEELSPKKLKESISDRKRMKI